MNYGLESTEHLNRGSALIMSIVIFSRMLINMFGLEILCTSVTLFMKNKMGLFFSFIVGFKYKP